MNEESWIAAVVFAFTSLSLRAGGFDVGRAARLPG